ncbi:hypothetical protein B0H16DRAFT_1809641 [Mycena metata]|uniref:Uncharacterized protein n=1 Tax=Mycena metata TaxID=1033252 RepID=A0AAD7H6N0_9AGAR|nr:hypothetical protein B0H16DRAFT_1809641 [Mycena metata]
MHNVGDEGWAAKKRPVTRRTRPRGNGDVNLTQVRTSATLSGNSGSSCGPLARLGSVASIICPRDRTPVGVETEVPVFPADIERQRRRRSGRKENGNPSHPYLDEGRAGGGIVVGKEEALVAVLPREGGRTALWHWELDFKSNFCAGTFNIGGTLYADIEVEISSCRQVSAESPGSIPGGVLRPGTFLLSVKYASDWTQN